MSNDEPVRYDLVTHRWVPATRTWEAIDREPHNGQPLDQLRVYVDDVGGSPGQPYRIELVQSVGVVEHVLDGVDVLSE